MFAELKRLQFQQQYHTKKAHLISSCVQKKGARDAANTLICFKDKDHSRTKPSGRLAQTMTLAVNPNQEVMWGR